MVIVGQLICDVLTTLNVDVVEVVVDDDSDAGGQDEVLDLGEALSEVLFAVERNVHENVIHKIYFNWMNQSSSVAN